MLDSKAGSYCCVTKKKEFNSTNAMIAPPILNPHAKCAMRTVKGGIFMWNQDSAAKSACGKIYIEIFSAIAFL